MANGNPQMPSRFIDELPEEHVEVLTPPGLYGSQAAAPAIMDTAARADTYNSPGWRRMQARAGHRGMGQPREARHQIIDLDAVARFGLGDRVFHQKFGYGAVTGIEGDKLEIAFDKAGVKNVVASEGTPSGGDQGSRGSRPAAVALARAAARWAGPRPALAPPTHPPAPGAASPVAAVGNTICACP
jgi:hypothetical protein